MIEIERIEIVLPIHGRTGTVMAQRVETINGRTSFIEPIDLTIGFDGSALPQEVADALAAINAQQQATIATLTTERDSAQSELTELQADYDAKVAELQAAQESIADLQAELEAIRNPPNPFPNADWSGFRSAALVSPAILRMAARDVGNFIMLLLYIMEMQKDPSVAAKMAAVWNEMETRTPLTTEEIASINGLAQQYQVPMMLGADGQIGQV